MPSRRSPQGTDICPGFRHPEGWAGSGGIPGRDSEPPLQNQPEAEARGRRREVPCHHLC